MTEKKDVPTAKNACFHGNTCAIICAGPLNRSVNHPNMELIRCKVIFSIFGMPLEQCVNHPNMELIRLGTSYCLRDFVLECVREPSQYGIDTLTLRSNAAVTFVNHPNVDGRTRHCVKDDQSRCRLPSRRRNQS